MEEWKDIPGYNGKYQASTTGLIRRGSYIFNPSISTWGGYQYITLSKPNRKKYLVHRVIAKTFIEGFKESDLVDHIDMDKMNNDISNLRVSNKSLNAVNCVKRKGCCSSEYKGVSFNKQANKWHAYVGSGKKRISLGLFESEKLAALAYDKKVVEVYGDHARLNCRSLL